MNLDILAIQIPPDKILCLDFIQAEIIRMGFIPPELTRQGFILYKKGLRAREACWQKKIDRQLGDRLKRCSDDFQFISESLRWYDPDQVPRVYSQLASQRTPLRKISLYFTSITKTSSRFFLTANGKN
jgi:hypothetical protein